MSHNNSVPVPPRGKPDADSADSYTRVQKSNNMTDRASTQEIDGHHEKYTTLAGRVAGRGHSYTGPVPKPSPDRTA